MKTIEGNLDFVECIFSLTTYRMCICVLQNIVPNRNISTYYLAKLTYILFEYWNLKSIVFKVLTQHFKLIQI